VGKFLTPLLIVLFGLTLAACGQRHAIDTANPPTRNVAAPHGGTLVTLGREEFHLEFVRDVAAGRLTVYLYDSLLSIPVRSRAPGFELLATVGGESRSLTFVPVANAARHETVGDTACFAAEDEWLKSESRFDAVLPSIKLLNTTFLRVSFPFPAGNKAP
jgi:hypothetical protein